MGSVCEAIREDERLCGAGIYVGSPQECIATRLRRGLAPHNLGREGTEEREVAEEPDSDLVGELDLPRAPRSSLLAKIV